jgi:hypothetical protein
VPFLLEIHFDAYKAGSIGVALEDLGLKKNVGKVGMGDFGNVTDWNESRFLLNCLLGRSLYRLWDYPA